ncbi:MAG: hypothetical protein J7539_11595 [Niabella sp.]|nr:hypothetical protein [Niabella sp.]
MRVNKKEATIINNAIDQWEQTQTLDPAKAGELRKTVSEYKDDLGSLTFYAFVAAISCTILAFGAIVLDERWIERLRNFFSFSELLIGVVFLALSVFFIWIAKKRKQRYPDAVLSYESFTVLIVLSLGVAVTYLARAIGGGYSLYGLVILVLSIAYGVVSQYLQSKLLWACTLLTFVVSFAVQSWSWSGPQHDYFLGMNYPLRLTVFCGALLLLLNGIRNSGTKIPDAELSSQFLWVLFLLSGLLVSVSGNLNYDVWSNIRQGRLWLWALGYSVLLCGLVVYAYKRKNEFFRDLVLLFFLLNIYTRYFEYFWDRTNKGIFFAVLALSFWLIGRKAEQMRRKFTE